MLLFSEETSGVLEVLQGDIEQLKPSRWKEVLESMMPTIISFAFNLVIALVLLFIGQRIIKLILKIMKRSFQRSNLETSVSKFLYDLVRAALYAILFFIVVERIGFPTSSVIAILGSAGLAVGLALQGSLSNFAGGVLILLLHPFKVGDYIIEDSKKNEGKVESIGLFYTTLLTDDNRRIVLPNGALANSSLTNVSSCNKRRLDIEVQISYEADFRKAKEVLVEVMKAQEAIISEDPISAFIAKMENGMVTLSCRAWVPSDRFWTTKCMVIEEVKLALDQQGIPISYPQLGIYVNN